MSSPERPPRSDIPLSLGPPSPVQAWHRRAAWGGLLWGLIELGACLWLFFWLAFDKDGFDLSRSAVLVILLSAVLTLLLPVSLLLIRRCLPLFAYQLALFPAIYPTSLGLLLLFASVSEFRPKYPTEWLFLGFLFASVLVRGVVVGAMVSVARHRARMYGR